MYENISYFTATIENKRMAHEKEMMRLHNQLQSQVDMSNSSPSMGEGEQFEIRHRLIQVAHHLDRPEYNDLSKRVNDRIPVHDIE